MAAGDVTYDERASNVLGRMIAESQGVEAIDEERTYLLQWQATSMFQNKHTNVVERPCVFR